jgi:hypothetical protein
MFLLDMFSAKVCTELHQSYTFARDLRTWTMFNEAVQDNAVRLGKLTKRVRGMINVLVDFGGDGKKSVRGRLRDVQAVLDKGGGDAL